MKILVTGAGGFIGGFIVEEALRRGMDVWAAVRKTTSRRYLQDSRIHFIELDFDDPQQVSEALSQELNTIEGRKWDYVVHNLGATKCTNFRDFERINYGYVKTLADTLIALDAVPQKFLLMSSLSAMGVGDEKGYTPFKETDIPMPNTQYGVSKIKAEQYLKMLAGFPYVVFRCTGVYGPREKDYFMMIKSIRNGVDASVGMKEQRLSFLYVKDLACAVCDALERSATAKTYLIAGEGTYTQKEFREIVMEVLGKRVVFPLVLPLWALYVVSVVAEWIGIVKGTPSTFNRDKYKIMSQRNWACDITAAREGFGFSPRYSLKDGVKESIAWYKENKWL